MNMDCFLCAESMPEGASVPSLGLSNKAVFTDGPEPADDDGYFVPVTLTGQSPMVYITE
jgi:hypothetical protein